MVVQLSTSSNIPTKLKPTNAFPNSNQDSSMNPEDLASQSVRLKEEQLRREEEKLREIEVKVQREINEKRQELLARESQLREIEARMQREQSHGEDVNGELAA